MLALMFCTDCQACVVHQRSVQQRQGMEADLPAALLKYAVCGASKFNIAEWLVQASY